VGKRFILSSLSIVFALTALGQKITPKGHILADSMKIGEAFEYALSIQYPKHSEVIFPDSTFDYSPYEFYGKRYFPTRQDSVFAYDSVVYSLASFEIDPVQVVQLPVFMLHGADSVEVLPLPDSIVLQQMVTHVPDSLNLRENVSFHKVPLAFNYPYLMIGSVVLVVLLVGIYLIFGKSIRKKIQLYRLRKEYEKFSAAFDKGISKLKKDQQAQLIEEVLVVWKQYMEKLEDRPFTKYTTREILKSGYGEALKDVLSNIDKAIYGHYDSDAMHKNFEKLEDFTEDRYKLRLREVTNG
jgi:hypothetical protein